MPNQKAAPRAEFPSVLEAVRKAAGDACEVDGDNNGHRGRLYAFLNALLLSPAGAPASLYADTDAPEDGDFSLPALETVPRDLGLSNAMTPEDLHRIRREFALKNHPDRVPPALRGLATMRMVAANTLIDQALARCREAGR
jgi:hypothetical protein